MLAQILRKTIHRGYFAMGFALVASWLGPVGGRK